ncbi:Rossmann-fold NAD(P)-binding domain-containing protein [Sphingomicrobium lutaoense]|uniref:Uncharacterized protein YbjT (DUF2867 family) n=1 Tax=Sphingomicrobium lutaoense TaxID=515949 RepID=A0A839Z2R2_9SPHN|nr:nucleoside-diphosphate sugar epimerase [Sphingomicrobium lutaoense]MBB3764347.1 uncharacterized protein YbjT (DUF2867 family) [Sphingomicrobium lutaoense]
MRIALIGATGLIGRSLVPMLARHDLLTLGRRESLPFMPHHREKVGPIEDWPGLLEGDGVDVAIAAIGTTWAKVRDWEKFEAIDRHGVTSFAEGARRAGARQLIVISSALADADSRNRYLAIKGRMEADVRKLGFERVDVVRPGLLRGKRGSDRRPGERFGILISPLLNLLLRGPLEKYQAIDAEQVARAVAALVGKAGGGVFIHHNRELKALGE